MLGICPHCKEQINNLVSGIRVEATDVGVKAGLGTGPSFRAAVLSCPKCRVILSVVPDPNATATDVEQRLKGK